MCHRVEEGMTQLQRLVMKMPVAAEVCISVENCLFYCYLPR